MKTYEMVNSCLLNSSIETGKLAGTFYPSHGWLDVICTAA